MARASAFKVLGLGGLLGVANAVYTPTTPDDSCIQQKAVCDREELCSLCTIAIAANRNSPEACSRRYPKSETVCELLGASYCCIFEDEADSRECANDPTTADYWECVLGYSGCVIESMPCFGDSGEGDRSENNPKPSTPSTFPGGGGDRISFLAMADPEDTEASPSDSTVPSARSLEQISTRSSSSTGCGGTRAPDGIIVAGDTPSPTQSVRCIDIPTSYGYSSDSSTLSPTSTSNVIGEGTSAGPTGAPTATTGERWGAPTPPPLLSTGCGGTPVPARAVVAGETPSPTQSVRCIDIPSTDGYSSSSSTGTPTTAAATEAGDRGFSAGETMAPSSEAELIDGDDFNGTATDGGERLTPSVNFIIAGALGLLMARAMFE